MEYTSKVRLAQFDPSENLDRGASRVKEITWYLIKVCFFLSALPYPNRFKTIILRKFGAKIGIGLVIKPRVNIHFPWKLEIGDHVWIGEEVSLLNFEKLSIGNNVCISQRVLLCGGNHDYRSISMPYRNGPIVLKDGCWIGACCFVAAGVTVGVDTVVTAGSIVTVNLKDNGIYKGNPLNLVKDRWIDV
ncbi:WcaF family extracellular polysaccharide biosynthesis acetyltransferase [Arcticibacter eurypsychrophilus]|uniref:WcaF family extracellular polysaccharide biosynthesis acetyltransferase n=1 Tax=Arcticibacter eurypsychrophilus TaxID=1434752 RepID=UPI00084D54A2|nr:WcaF family extracellular polysaccharide biosynthesis acetyltransferase [Arcticibacter eurypsychrophilus]